MSNVLTEEEARKRWCPFARSFDTPTELPEHIIASGTNRKRGGAPDQWCLCIASDCMVWRWRAGLPNDVGYCGLAGAP
jgi:hypothetical protein